jgi:pimeloyl-ACP methyl ester carboxylesterase
MRLDRRLALSTMLSLSPSAPLGRPVAATALSALLAAASPAPSAAWCGAAFPPYAYQLPWFEFAVGADQAAMRVVGDAAVERARKLSPLLVLPPPGLTYEYLEPLEALTISERRIAFVAFRPSAGLEQYAAQAAAALEALEASGGVHVLGHGTGAVTALALRAARPDRVKSLILASPLASLDDAVEGAREALAAGPPPLLEASASTKARACVDAEIRRARQQPAAAAAFGAALGATQSDAFAELLRGAGASGVPLLLTRGSADLSSEATAQRIRERVPGTQLATFEGSGSLAHVDLRSAYNARVLDYLDAADGVQTRRSIMLPGSMAPGGSVRD